MISSLRRTLPWAPVTKKQSSISLILRVSWDRSRSIAIWQKKLVNWTTTITSPTLTTNGLKCLMRGAIPSPTVLACSTAAFSTGLSRSAAISMTQTRIVVAKGHSPLQARCRLTELVRTLLASLKPLKPTTRMRPKPSWVATIRPFSLMFFSTRPSRRLIQTMSWELMKSLTISWWMSILLLKTAL